jgi:hypothetical protein
LVLLNRHAAFPPTRRHPQHRNHVIASVDQLQQIGSVRIERAESILKPRANTIQAVIDLKVAKTVNLNVGVVEPEGDLVFAADKRLPGPPRPLTGSTVLLILLVVFALVATAYARSRA